MSSFIFAVAAVSVVTWMSTAMWCFVALMWLVACMVSGFALYFSITDVTGRPRIWIPLMLAGAVWFALGFFHSALSLYQGLPFPNPFHTSL